ncbi:hypothetical protein BDV06DRAFT_202533 [Aspergillus oleicola]
MVACIMHDGAVADALSKGPDSLGLLVSHCFIFYPFMIHNPSSPLPSPNTVVCCLRDDIPIIESSPETPTTVVGC